MAQNNNMDLGDDIIDNRLCSNTKTQYKRKVKHFFEWIGENHPEIINDTHDAGEDISRYIRLKNSLVTFAKRKNAMKLVLLQNFQIHGALPITHAQVVEMMNDLKTTVVQAIHDKVTTANLNLEKNLNNNAVSLNLNNNNNQQYRSWTWNGKFHYVPQDFRFPK
jgi:nitrate/nitrite-specific signal transduction histidine kinase